MLSLNRKLEYALISLKHLSGKAPGQLTSVKEVSEAYGSPFDATARVMQIMANRGLLKSEQGAHGGYQIIKDLRRISFYDLSQMILGPLEIARCLAGGADQCEMLEGCNIRSPLMTFNDRLVEFYKGISLQDLIDGGPSSSGRAVKNSRPELDDVGSK